MYWRNVVISVLQAVHLCVWHTDPLAGWECINKNSNYMAYRKLFKDTGLYQYKVIGQFDDITAKDFLDVQVSVIKDWILNLS